ncbi:35321_t:CDS:2, partial [Gigaspora margarita]
VSVGAFSVAHILAQFLIGVLVDMQFLSEYKFFLFLDEATLSLFSFQFWEAAKNLTYSIVVFIEGI